MNSLRLLAFVPLLMAGGCSASLLQSKMPEQASYALSAEPSPANAPAPGVTGVGAGSASGSVSASASGSGAGSRVDAAAGFLPIDLTILKPTVRPGLDTDRILASYPDKRLDYFSRSRWTGVLGDVIQDLAVQVFRARGGLRSVNSESSHFAGPYLLEIEVQEFQAEYGESSPPDGSVPSTAAGGAAPKIRVRMSARVAGVADRHALGSFEASVLEPAAENRMGAIVAAYERAANEALNQLATQNLAVLRTLPADRP